MISFRWFDMDHKLCTVKGWSLRIQLLFADPDIIKVFSCDSDINSQIPTFRIFVPEILKKSVGLTKCKY